MQVGIIFLSGAVLTWLFKTTIMNSSTKDDVASYSGIDTGTRQKLRHPFSAQVPYYDEALVGVADNESTVFNNPRWLKNYEDLKFQNRIASGIPNVKDPFKFGPKMPDQYQSGWVIHT